jgi:D-3-phosphoglycerate dehydrogenase / 2-oxoglutarate reductase
VRIINIDSYFKDIRGYDYERRLLHRLGASLVLATARTEDDIVQACRGCAVVLVEHADTPVTKAVINRLDDCHLIAKYSVGLDNVDVAAATQRRIIVCHAPNFCAEEVSDHAVALLLALTRRIVQLNEHVRRGGWFDLTIEPPMRRTKNRVLGLVGFGRIARLVAEKLKPFGVRILAFDPFVDPKTAEAHGVALVSLEKLFAESDFVSIHTPLTKDTRHLIGARLLGLMKPTSFLVNTSRGLVIDEVALFESLRDRRIAGAALDVTGVEPLPASSPLRGLDNVILTPHQAATSLDSLNDVRYTIAASVEAYHKGYWPEFVANRDVKSTKPLRAWQKFAESKDRLVRLDDSGRLVDLD